jgi:hypothetical protein
MPNYIAFGYEDEEPDLVIDWHKQRAMRKVDANRLVGAVALEPFVKGLDEISPAMLLMKRGWKDLYLVKIREDWEEEDYFEMAEEAIKKHGILYP